MSCSVFLPERRRGGRSVEVVVGDWRLVRKSAKSGDELAKQAVKAEVTAGLFLVRAEDCCWLLSCGLDEPQTAAIGQSRP